MPGESPHRYRRALWGVGLALLCTGCVWVNSEPGAVGATGPTLKLGAHGPRAAKGKLGMLSEEEAARRLPTGLEVLPPVQQVAAAPPKPAPRTPRVERLGPVQIAGVVEGRGLLRRPPAARVALVGYEGAPAEQPGAAWPEAIPAPPALAGGTRVTDTFIETDVRQAVQSLASQAGAVVIVDDQVRGAATAVIEDEPLETALRQVLLPLGYVMRRGADGCYYVGLSDPDSALFGYLAEKYRYTALNRSPEDLVALLPPGSRPYVRVAGQGGWLVVEAPSVLAQRILSDLEESDQPVPQVVLEALICVYSPGSSFRFGFDLDAGVRLYDRATRVALSGLSLAGALGTQNASMDLNDFQITSSVLRMLEQKGFVQIRAAPRVMAVDGEKAMIHIGRESFFSVQPESNGGFIFRQDIQKVSSGIMLEITPSIRDPYVAVKIDRAEVSEDIRSDETQANPSDRFPVINRRSVATTVTVRDGETIVIGGLTQRQKVNQHNKIPCLGDLPLVGKMFQRTERLDVKTEVAIFISPRIIDEERCRGCLEIPAADDVAAVVGRG